MTTSFMKGGAPISVSTSLSPSARITLPLTETISNRLSWFKLESSFGEKALEGEWKEHVGGWVTWFDTYIMGEDNK